MHIFKRNIIVFTTFSVVTLYIVTPANANEDLCLMELTRDNFDTENELGSANIEHAILPLVDSLIITPHGMTYRLNIRTYEDYKVPLLFCKWIYEDHDHNQHHKNIKEFLINESIQTCLIEIEKDYSQINLAYSLRNLEYDVEPSGSQNLEDDVEPSVNPLITTHHGKSYSAYKNSISLSEITPTEFCHFIYEDPPETRYRKDKKKKENKKVKNFTILRKRFIRKIIKSQCLKDLENDKFIMNDSHWLKHEKNVRTRTEDDFKTLHGKRYRANLLQALSNKDYRQDPMSYCVKYSICYINSLY